MEKIRFYTRFSERQNRHYYDDAQIISKVPTVGDELFFLGTREVVDAVRPAWVDCEQPSREVFNYDIFEIQVHDAENPDDCGWRYVAVLNTNEEE